MFITVDAIFHEESMYFSSGSEPQREKNHKEEYKIQEEYQLLDNKFFSQVNGSNDLLEHHEQNIDNQLECERMVELEPEVMSLSIENEEVIEESESQTNIPHQLSAKDAPTFEPEPPRKQLPERLTGGIPKPTCEPEILSKAKYPMNHYVSNQNLSNSNKSFMNQLSTMRKL